ncbi:MAG: hypothetical protein OEU54_10170 [Gemmatimonadota bacterium]|nr:hypothetical protein [Gemmatimonadota bacterium]
MTSEPWTPLEVPPRVSTIRTIWVMLVCLIVPAVLTLLTIKGPPGPAPNTLSTGGYTVSLLLFAMPVSVFGIWFFMHPREAIDRKALLFGAIAVSLLGTILDVGFAYSFFTFPNPDSTVHFNLPAWSWGTMKFVGGYIPIEEFGFYILGALFMITTYIWADAEWLWMYTHPQRGDEAWEHRKIVKFSPWPVLIAVVLIAIAYVVKRSIDGSGFPGYFTFLCLLAFVPATFVIQSVGRFINWRAFFFAYAALLLVSLLWEATLGVPYNWWNYQCEQMMGLRITAWANLPVEAVMLWMAGSWGAVGAYETFRMAFHLMERHEGRTFWQTLFGPVPPDGDSADPGEAPTSRQ